MDTAVLSNSALSEDIAEFFRQSMAMHEELLLDYAEHAEYIFADLILLNRSDVQAALEEAPQAFRETELNQLQEADRHLLDNIQTAAQWVRYMAGKPGKPASH